MINGRSAFDIAWRHIFHGAKDPTQLESLRNLFPMNSDRMESYRLSTLHKAVLQLDYYTLEEEIEAHRSIIDGTDKDGNTALQWAAGRGDSEAVNQLLSAGADANSRSHNGASILHDAVRQSHLQIVQILLGAGADPGQVDLHGYSVLHYARGAGVVKVIECLVKAGAETNARDHKGGSPLKFFVIRRDVEAAKAILNLGADIDLLDDDGDSALVESMSRGSDDTTELLLSRGANYSIWYSNGCSILHLAAFFGGFRTLNILHNARLHGIDPDALSRQGQTALQIAQARTFKSDGFVERLQELLTDIRVRNANLHSPVRANPDKHDLLITSQCPHSKQPGRRAGRSRLRDIVLRLVQIIMLLALIYTGSHYVYRVLELGWLVKTFTQAWSMVSPDDFMEL